MRAHPTLAPFRALLSAWSAELGFLLVRPVLSCGRHRHSARVRPPEVSSVDPYPVHDHGEPACEGDLTTDAIVPLDLKTKTVMAAREEGVVAGLDLAALAFRLIDPTIRRPYAGGGSARRGI
jgi:Quinolinate phosphoribosyl transferase, N-terminal domain